MTSSSPLLKRPRGFDEIVATFGDPRKHLRDDGTPRPSWETRILARLELVRTIPLSWAPEKLVSRIRCHRLIVEPLRAALRAVDEAGLWEELRDFAGCYQWRSTRGGSKFSTHCWAIAVDFDTRDGRNALGSEPVIHPGIVQCFEANGFYWGGRFSRPDPMHFQLAENY